MKTKDQDMIVNNHFEAGAIVNHGQMNVGGGVIKVYRNGEVIQEEETKDLARLITDYLAPANKYLKEGWEERMYDFWKAVVAADEDIFVPKNKGDRDFNKKYAFHVIGYLKNHSIYKSRASRLIVGAIGEEEDKYRQYIDKALDGVGDKKLQDKLMNAINHFIQGN